MTEDYALCRICGSQFFSGRGTFHILDLSHFLWSDLWVGFSFGAARQSSRFLMKRTPCVDASLDHHLHLYHTSAPLQLQTCGSGCHPWRRRSAAPMAATVPATVSSGDQPAMRFFAAMPRSRNRSRSPQSSLRSAERAATSPQG
jgi:hypothetical protein